jgi:hypothetical protein
MAQATGTYSTYDIVGARESLEDKIYQITPEETPFLKQIGRGKPATAKYEEWQTDALATPAANAKIEGDEYAYTAPTATTRVGNRTQISWKTVIVTETADAVSKAGRNDELAYQVAKMGVELRKDQEFIVLSNTASVTGDDVTARTLGGFPAWLTTNDSRGATGSDGGFTAGNVVAATNGTQRAFTKTLLDDNLELTYKAGGNVKTVMVSPYNKRVFSTFMSDENVAQFRMAASSGQGTIVGAADMYVSDFGTVSIVPNRVMGTAAALARNVLLITPDMVELAVLRPMKTETPAKTGDANKKVIKTEYTLRVANEAAHGIIADTFGLTAST